MRWKVPAASGRPAACSHTRSSRPEATPAAHADRMLQTPPDIATRSQSAGRGVNRPAARPPLPPPWRAPAQLEPAALLRSIPGGWQLPPIWGQPLQGGPVLCLPRRPPKPGPAFRGSCGLSAHHAGEVPACPLGSLSGKLASLQKPMLEALPLGRSRCQSAPPATPPPIKQGVTPSSRALPGCPGPHTLGWPRGI